MTRYQLIAAEVALILGGLVLVFAIVGNPFSGEGGNASGGEALAAVELIDQPPGDVPEDDSDDEATPEATLPPPVNCAPPADRDFFSANQIISYYGNPYTETMGILGQLEPEELVLRVKEHAESYNQKNRVRGMQPALHMVSTTAQPRPGNEGLYVLHVDKDTIQEYVDLACRHGLIIFLDLQIGRNTLQAELDRIRPFLEQPNVHLALDPEFKMDEGEVPGQVIGSYNADELNEAQAYLQQLVEEEDIPDKIMIVHQFTDEMIERKDEIGHFNRVRVIVTMDGFGDPATKAKKFKWYGEPAEYSGIKLFFEQDHPLMTEEEVVKIRPDLIIYQ
jgi:hypothetical protein